MRVDAVVRNGVVVTDRAVGIADIAIVGGTIAEIGPELEVDGAEEIDARGLHVLPGVIDAHMHINEPGRTDWEGWSSGSAALAAGGAAACLEMPLNANPPTVDPAAFDAKLAAASTQSHVDFALWGGLIPGHLDQLPALAERGVVGFKAFMSASGTPDFPAADDHTLLAGMRIAAGLGLPVAVHAENDAITAGLARDAIAEGRTSARDYLRSRPVVAETEAIGRAIHFAAEAGCALHVVHVSSGAGVASVVAARASGLDVTCETCPHYLVFNEEDVERIGALAKCAPPIRDHRERDLLWAAVADGSIDLVASDHSPAPMTMKTSADFFRIWGGIAGCQSTLALLLTEGVQPGRLGLSDVARLLAGAVAARFALPAKGRISTSCDADLTLVDLDRRWSLTRDDLLDRHRINPYVDRPLRGEPVRTMLRGRTIARAGRIVGEPTGRLLRPAS